MKFIIITVTISWVMYHALVEGESQWQCTEVTRRPTGDCRWGAGLDLNAGQVVTGGKIAAYKIQWFYGGWSGWYVPGYNDIDWKLNLGSHDVSCPPYIIKPNSRRRVWSYFVDHNHMFVVCKP